MRSPVLPAVVALCIVIAGCTGVAIQGPVPPSPDASGPTPSPTIETSSRLVAADAADGLDAPEPGERPSPAGSDEPPTTRNPWGTRTIVVNATDGQGDVPAIRPLVERTLRYWERNDGRYADYTVNFTYRPAAPTAAVTIRYVENTSQCGRHGLGRPLGCAPQLEADTGPPRPVMVTVRADQPDTATLLTLKHEFGHVLGIDHGEAPMPLMARSNLHAKAAPWDRQAIGVTVVEAQGGDPPSGGIRQVEHALSYYDSGADGFTNPDDVGFRGVDQRSAANVVVVLATGTPHNRDPYSTMQTVNGSVDGTVYRRATITLYGVDSAAIGWHVGYWLGYLLGASDRSALPPAFREDEFDHRRSRWWR